MARTSIGQFIAALRKANGMTQQDVADRLNVSNKAVSRWERDECAPDIALIPALAELLGVTCDELLKGERILETDTAEKIERKEPKVDRQVKALIGRTLSSFKMLVWIALALSVIGLILMFGISYGFYLPVIGFAVMLLFEAVSSLLTILAITKANDVKRDNEVFDMADDAQITCFNHVVGNLSFWSFYAILASIVASTPLILFTSNYIHSVLSFEPYFIMLLGIVLLLIPICLKCKAPYIAWVTNSKLPEQEPKERSQCRNRMNLIQIGLIVLAGILFVLAPWCSRADGGIDLAYIIVITAGLTALAASIVYFIVFIIRQKEKRHFMLSGVRNIFLVPAAIFVSNIHDYGYTYYEVLDGAAPIQGVKYDLWNYEYLWYAVAYCLLVFCIFALIRACINAKTKSTAV